MINQHSIDTIQNSSFGSQFMKPVYDSYSFSRIPQTFLNLLMKENKAALPSDTLPTLSCEPKQIILFFFDAFGWRFFHKYVDEFPFLKRFIDNGVANKISTQFPSTTAAHVTCIHTGMTPASSGIYEWQYYEPKLDTIISPLMFTFGGSHKRNELLKTGIEPKDILPPITIYQQLKARSIDSFVFQHTEYTPSPYTDHVTRDATMIPYKTLPEAYINLSDLLKNNQGKNAYYMLYYDKIDSLCHQYGPESPQLEAEIRSVFTMIEAIFMKAISQIKNVLLTVTADHGQTEINPKTAWYINQQAPEILSSFNKNKAGQMIVPAGSCRDMFLYVKENQLVQTKEILSKKLKGIAEVYETQTLIDQHFFGDEKPSKPFLHRVGNLVILPYQKQTVWWFEEKKYGVRFLGHHGGLTRNEAETIFLSLAL